MTTLLLVIQAIIVLCLICVILLQKTGTDSLAGLSGGGSGVFSSKGTANALTRITVFLAIAFVLNSLLIARIINDEHKHKQGFASGIVSATEVENKLEAGSDAAKNVKKKVEAPDVAE